MKHELYYLCFRVLWNTPGTIHINIMPSPIRLMTLPTINAPECPSLGGAAAIFFSANASLGTLDRREIVMRYTYGYQKETLHREVVT
jgi:hypothetical protein